MLGDSTSTALKQPPASSKPPSPAAARPPIAPHDGESEGDNGVNSSLLRSDDPAVRDKPEDDGDGPAGDKTFGGNRWPRQETLALLKIRSDMDVAFKEASVKGPLWDEVSGKLAELGYHRSAKKCREKFENVFKYHKRTKEGRTGKPEGKTYRFFDQLEAFQTPAQNPQRANHSISHVAMGGTVSSSPLMSFSHPPYATPNAVAPPPAQLPNAQPQPANVAAPSFFHEFASDSSSSSTSSDVEIQGRHRRKRKWKEFFERLLREVIQKQEDMQRRFLEAIEKKEQERIAREDTWRMQEIARINREREILAHERSISAVKDAAVMSFLQKLSDSNHTIPSTVLPPVTDPLPHMSALVKTTQMVPVPVPVTVPKPIPEENNNVGDPTAAQASSSRWPKSEVQALIKLRSKLESKYQDNGPKGPLWEEISTEMRQLGYNRSSKRCKEKWENINKYFKKVKESNKSRPEDSKTCPYFHQLDALYKEKNKTFDGSSSSALQFRSDSSVPLLVQPEQQWPPMQARQLDDIESEHDNDDEEKDNEEDDEYQLVSNMGSKAGDR